MGHIILSLLLKITDAAGSIDLTPGVTVLVMPDQGEIADDPQDRDNVGSVGVGLQVKTVIGNKAERENYDNQMF